MAASGRSPGRLVTPSFAVAVAILGMAALFSGPFASWKNFKRQKETLPLRRPLRELDRTSLAPYRVVKEIVLPATHVEALGTEHYGIWQLEDESVPRNDPLRKAELSVTYYSASEQMVLHTPDVCALGSGYERAQPHENQTIEVPNLGSVPVAVPVRVCTFIKTAIFGGKKHSVVYTFHCNGRFVASANRVRLMINDPRDTHAYFSKVEVSFRNADRAACIRGARKLYARVLPLLLRDHWPDFEEAERISEKSRAGVP